MAKRCVLSGKKPQSGHSVSHAHNKTKRWWKPNLHYKRLYVPELKRTLRIRVSAHALRTIGKIGLLAYLRRQNLSLQDL